MARLSTFRERAGRVLRRTPVLSPAAESALTARAARRGFKEMQREGHPAAAPIAAAVEALRGGALPEPEALWASRIEGRRAELAEGDDELRLDRTATATARRDGLERLRSGYVASRFSIRPRWGRFMLRLVRELKPDSCLELGAAAGISTAYQAAGLELNAAGKLSSIEGQPAMAALARETLAGLHLARAQVIEGAFEEVLGELVASAQPIELAFIDADHVEEATLRNFEAVHPGMAAGGVLVFDDIHQSAGMTRAWRRIAADPRVGIAVDLRRMGICALEAP